MIDNQQYINHETLIKGTGNGGDTEDAEMINGRSHFAEIMAYSLDISKIIHPPNSVLPISPRKLKVPVASRTKTPPSTYVCRLCKVAGHWIDECVHFKPRSSKASSTGRTCLLCEESGHRIEQCKKYSQSTTGVLNHAAKAFNSEYVLANEEFLNF